MKSTFAFKKPDSPFLAKSIISFSIVFRISLLSLLLLLQGDSTRKMYTNVVLAIDVSGSMTEIGSEQINTYFVRNQIEQIEKNGGGSITVVGFLNQKPKFYYLSIPSRNWIVRRLNVNNYWSDYILLKIKFLAIISNEIINKKPNKKNDYSYIENTLMEISILLNQVQFSDKVNFVIIHSDMINDLPDIEPSRPSHWVLLRLRNTNSVIFLHGCSNNDIYAELAAIRIYNINQLNIYQITK